MLSDPLQDAPLDYVLDRELAHNDLIYDRELAKNSYILLLEAACPGPAELTHGTLTHVVCLDHAE